MKRAEQVNTNNSASSDSSIETDLPDHYRESVLSHILCPRQLCRLRGVRISPPLLLSFKPNTR